MNAWPAQQLRGHCAACGIRNDRLRRLSRAALSAQELTAWEVRFGGGFRNAGGLVGETRPPVKAGGFRNYFFNERM